MLKRNIITVSYSKGVPNMSKELEKVLESSSMAKGNGWKVMAKGDGWE
ncbi:KxxxW-cyclized peptide pheromone [Streptococcus thermophilus]|nr:KxxxW-cyclized peptide pheromone [Streptococcus thermophilus]MCE2230677.1 KxxxW-cyclized peptide pheromone [Streptococcus thermophilus]MCE2233159.1 KxxxW-cyclized peptide pheromone [Streptococcus thermophilus]MCE2235392.1 KxxxW-cyclized peptide pheromone [Streptococcus thermophilus]MCE2239349.1 KxxxW-cyclized peptide pheromone [Streptococcus thermophilus]